MNVVPTPIGDSPSRTFRIERGIQDVSNATARHAPARESDRPTTLPRPIMLEPTMARRVHHGRDRGYIGVCKSIGWQERPEQSIEVHDWIPRGGS